MDKRKSKKGRSRGSQSQAHLAVEQATNNLARTLMFQYGWRGLWIGTVLGGSAVGLAWAYSHVLWG